MRKEDDGIIFAGTVFARNRRIAGSGFVDIGNTTSFKIKSETEKKERISHRKDSVGQVLDSISIPKPTGCQFSLDTFDRHNLALALMGVDTALTQAAEEITDEPLTIGKQGQWYALAHQNIDPATPVAMKLKSGEAVDAALVSVNHQLGLVMIAQGSSTVPDGAEITVTYKTRKVEGFKIAAGSLTDFDLEIRIEGTNRVNGREGELHIPSVVVAADSEIDWLGDDYATASFSGSVVKTGDAAPYTFSEVA